MVGWTMVSTWWRHQMETFSALLVLCAGNSPLQRPVTGSFDIFFDLCLNKRLSKQSRRRWFKTPSRSLWRHCNVTLVQRYFMRSRRPFSTVSYGVWGNKLSVRNFSVMKVSDLANVRVRSFKSHSYLTGITLAKLRWHLADVNAI